MTDVEREALLGHWINYYVASGYALCWRDRFSAQLERSKEFSWLAAILLFLLCVVPFIIYLFANSSGIAHSVHVQITEDGHVLINGKQAEVTPNGQVWIKP